MILPVAFVAALVLLSGPVLAQELNTYFIDADIQSSGNTKVDLILAFSEPTDKFELLLPIRIFNFNATSSAGDVVCDNELEGISLISCDLALTDAKKTLEISFESQDLVKNRRGGFFFAGDFSVKLPVRDTFVAVRIPEGMVLSEGISGGAVVPFSNSTSTDGRKITVIWRFDQSYNEPLSFQVFYEPGIIPGEVFGTPPLRVLVLLSIMVGGGILLVFLKRKKKDKEVVLSVLDEFEKKVISSIETAGGEVNQKKIVSDTNLSKAKVSKVIKRLAERGLVEIEGRGRTNIIRFSKKKLGS